MQRVRRLLVAGPGPAIVAGLVVRALVVAAGSGTSRFRFADSEHYLTFAGGLPVALWSPTGAEVPASLARGPAYPLLAWATGAPAHLLGLVAAQCLLAGVVNVVLAHRLAGRLGGAEAAGVAALAVALDPATIGHNLLIATETLAATAVLAVAVALEATARAAASPGDRSGVLARAAGLGVAAAGAALVRPNLAVLVPYAVVALVLAMPARRALGPAVVVLMAALIPLGLWVVRNDRVGGAPVLTTITGQNLADFGLAAAAVEDGRLDSWTPDRDALAEATEPIAEEIGLSPPVDGDTFSAATDARWRDEGLALLVDHPRGAATVAATGLARTLGAPGDSLVAEQAGDPPSPVRTAGRVAAMGWIVGMDVLAAVGTAAAIAARRRRALLVAAGIPIVVLAASLGPFLEPRFRVPVWPLLAVLAGLGTQAVVDRWDRHRVR